VTATVSELNRRIRGGVLPAMATPLEADGYRVNQTALAELIDFLIAAGVSGLFVGGTTGEGILLDVEERLALHERSLEIINGRVPALIHVGANSTAESVRLARHAQQAGAPAMVAVTPSFYPMPDDALLDYYQAIAAAAPEVPLLAYDIPQMAVNGIGPDLFQRLAAAIPSFAGLKSSRPDAQVVRRLIDAAPEGVLVLAGNEAIALGLLALGADGLISGLSTAVPEPFVALTRAFAAGQMAEAKRQQRQINRILALLPGTVRIGAMKQILAERGIAAGRPVPPRPLPPAGWSAWLEIQAILAE
jgi:2-dehydro-3-deoxy-D-pentonate aldolase